MQIFFESEFFICLTTSLHYDDFLLAAKTQLNKS